MTVAELQDQIRQLDDVQFQEIKSWVVTVEVNRRDAQPEIEQAVREQRAEDAAALWEQHPELKPAVQKTPEKPVATSVEDAASKVEIEAYRQPTGAHDSYPKGAKFIYKGRVWESLMDGYCWEPDAPGIDERFVVDVTDRFVKTTGEKPEAETPETSENTETSEQPTAPAYRQPSGAHDAYKQGDRVTYNGAVYESTINANVWAPDTYPAGWKKLA